MREDLTHKNHQNGACCLRTHNQRLFNISRFARSTNKSSKAIRRHFYPLISLMHVIYDLISVENNN